jgi:MOSC domain-containing protein YiiM
MLGGIMTVLPAPRVLSVNVGGPRSITSGRHLVDTAIFKTPVDGRVLVRGVNIDGDTQADRTVHGGPDKAAYAYANEEITTWEIELRHELGPPFGEKLTTQGLDVTDAMIGERWHLGTPVLEVAQPRLPCFKLGLRMGDSAFVKRFARASRPGAYLRIIEEGEIGAGDAVTVTDLPTHRITSRMVFDAILLDHTLIPEVRHAAQLPATLRRWLITRSS